jgi:hypothetical protein
VVDSGVAGSAPELGKAVISKDRERGRIGKADAALGIDHPHRLPYRGKDRVPLAKDPLGLHTLRDVSERHDGATAVRHVDRRWRV